MADSLSNIIDNSAEIRNAFNKQVILGAKAIGSKAEGYAKGDCPVDTGRLRNSISNKVTSGQLVISVYIGTNVEYAPYVEYRDVSHKTGKAHFLRDAATTHNDEYEKTMKAALEGTVV